MKKNGLVFDEAGNQYIYQNGLLHNTNGPAVKCRNGTEKWLCDNKFHREHGPAILYPSGDCEWWLNGFKHRLDGPAFDFESFKEWWVHGVRVPVSTNEEFQKWLSDHDVRSF